MLQVVLHFVNNTNGTIVFHVAVNSCVAVQQEIFNVC